MLMLNGLTLAAEQLSYPVPEGLTMASLLRTLSAMDEHHITHRVGDQSSPCCAAMQPQPRSQRVLTMNIKPLKSNGIEFDIHLFKKVF